MKLGVNLLNPSFTRFSPSNNWNTQKSNMIPAIMVLGMLD